MKTFQQRYYELFHQFVRDGKSIPMAMACAIRQIQYDVRRGVEYQTT